MTTTLTAPDQDAGRRLQSTGRTGDVWADRIFRGATLVAGCLVLAILALIAYATTKEAWPAFRHSGASMVTTNHWDPNTNHFGALAFIYGTVVTSVIALVIAVPVSIGIALFTTEIASERWRRPIVYVVDLLAAIPSVVYGLWGVLVLAPWIEQRYTTVANAVGSVPVLNSVFRNPSQGRSFMTAGIILAVMVTPIITALTRETMTTVAQDDKNAAIAMGATRWEMLRATVFPRTRSGTVGAVMLGLGRAMGETIAVALVIGANHQITSNVFSSGDSLAGVIAHEFGEATDVHRSALIGLGVILFVITIIVNVIARAIVRATDHGPMVSVV
jgi:phosphate transport system permease protein